MYCQVCGSVCLHVLLPAGEEAVAVFGLCCENRRFSPEGWENVLEAKNGDDKIDSLSPGGSVLFCEGTGLGCDCLLRTSYPWKDENITWNCQVLAFSSPLVLSQRAMPLAVPLLHFPGPGCLEGHFKISHDTE